MFGRAAILRAPLTRAAGPAAALQRVRRDIRPARGHLGLFPRAGRTAVPFAVGAYITAAYWFTASTSFANPAVTLARALTDTFAGIRPADAPGFIVAQLAGAAAATVLFRWLVPALPRCGRTRRSCRTMTAVMPRHEDRALRLRPQRRPLADGGGIVQSRWPSPTKARGDVGRHGAGAARPSRSRRRDARGRRRSVGSATPQKLTDELAQGAQLLITMGCGDECPVVPGLRARRLAARGSEGQTSCASREIRDEIRQRVETLLEHEGWRRSAGG